MPPEWILIHWAFLPPFADYSDLDVFDKTIQIGAEPGFFGAFCIHPKQAEILNRAFSTLRREIEQARDSGKAYEMGIARGKGAVEYRGKMIDLPIDQDGHGHDCDLGKVHPIDRHWQPKTRCFAEEQGSPA